MGQGMSSATPSPSPSPNELRARLLAIELPITKYSKQVFTLMMRHALRRLEGQILMVTGLSGTGKSHLKEQLYELAKELCAGLTGERRQLMVGLETVLNLGDLARQIATEIGNPVTMHKIIGMTAKNVSIEVFEDLKALGVRVIFLDEAHCIALAADSTSPFSVAMASWLKKLTNHGISIVFLGQPELSDKIILYKELRTRLYRKQPLMTPGLTAGTDEERAATLLFLDQVEDALGVNAEVPFSDPRIVIPMVSAMGGNLRDIMRLIGTAVEHTEMMNQSQVSIESFRVAAGLCGFPWKS